MIHCWADGALLKRVNMKNICFWGVVRGFSVRNNRKFSDEQKRQVVDGVRLPQDVLL